MKKLYIIGSGGFSKQVIEIVEKINQMNPTYDLMGLIDDNSDELNKEVLGYRVVGTTRMLKEISSKEHIYGVVAISNGPIRKKIVRELNNMNWTNLIHPSAVISDYIKVGEGNIVCGGTVINPDCHLGNHNHINIGTTLGHDVSLKNYITIMPGCSISGYVKLSEYAMIGTGSVIIQGLNIKQNVTIGAGATVVKNTEKSSLYVGTPAKKKGEIDNFK